MTWNDLQKLIDANQTFLVTSHVNPDGDAVGSQLAFYWYLTSLGKEVTLYNADPLPSKFYFFEGSQNFTSETPAEKYDVLCILDASNPTRVGWEGVMESAAAVVDIDHHRDNSNFGDVNIVDPAAAATCQIIYQLFTDNGVDYPAHVAQSLFNGILSDTGGFAFSNTDEELLRIGADLISRGADNVLAFKKLFASYSIQGLQLRAKIWSTLAFYAEQKIGAMHMDLRLIDELGADKGDMEGIANMAMSAEGVEVGVFMKYSEEEVRFSLRSIGNVDVGALAQTYEGGGGHRNAAGCSSFGKSPMDALEELVAKIEAVL